MQGRISMQKIRYCLALTINKKTRQINKHALSFNQQYFWVKKYKLFNWIDILSYYNKEPHWCSKQSFKFDEKIYNFDK